MDTRSIKRGVLFLIPSIMAGMAGNAQQHSRDDKNNRESRGTIERRGNDRYVRSVPPQARRVSYHGNYYHYWQGHYYRPRGNYFEIIIPPVGIRITSLPAGCRRFHYGNIPYYETQGVYYKQVATSDYEVVEPPLYAELTQLPENAKAIVINNSKYYELNGTYYKEFIKNNELWYRVEGSRGVLNTSSNTITTAPAGLVEVLPAGSRALVIDGKKYYLTPAGDYYSEEINEGKLLYKLAGK